MCFALVGYSVSHRMGIYTYIAKGRYILIVSMTELYQLFCQPTTSLLHNKNSNRFLVKQNSHTHSCMRLTPTCHELVCHGVLCYIYESDAFINGLYAGWWFCRWCQWTGVLWQGASSSTIECLWVTTMALNSLLILAETKCLNVLCFQDLQM